MTAPCDLDLRHMLVQADATLRDLDAAPIDRLTAAGTLLSQLSVAAGLPELSDTQDLSDAHAETTLSHGVALSPADAARCLHDYVRTYSFSEAVSRAIRAAQRQWPGERIRVLYAGTGPLAPLAVLQIPHFAPDEVGFTLLDIHDRSGQASARLIDRLGAQGYVDAYETADATCYMPAGGQSFHVIVAEVMQRALSKEPQVAVTAHLSQFLADGGHFVPKNVLLDLSLFDQGDIFAQAPQGGLEMRADYPRLDLGTVFTLNAQMPPLEGPAHADIALPPIHVPDSLTGALPANIVTRIETFDGLWVEEMASGLTTLHAVPLSRLVRGGDRLQLSYQLGAHPGLSIRFEGEGR